ncbi:uncharacterized protein RCO7_10281 [Rhynchosporium graminicola]|uniref:Uncharacterized protein n=1 Tax=Rhynchosporium graminicola TaxID=2792576 RepID=A0A1E1LD84_9HELO|nr:uncharacterized protein RCO7_10281 [Rhynchosporium commune]
MPSDQIVQQQLQAPEAMSASTSNIELQQPKPAPAMGDDVGMRGGESAGCECCGCEHTVQGGNHRPEKYNGMTLLFVHG